MYVPIIYVLKQKWGIKEIMYTPVSTNFTIYKSDVFLFVFRIILLDDALDCLISFTDFIYAFQVQFYYEGESYRKVC